ncbi:MAG: serine/threonine protein kinase [Synechococcales cyanobacterium T60_A2020_003]|nr:serine/threonine protein kinase [Synechococcales cyanobacterium T60_A2020_003]
MLCCLNPTCTKPQNLDDARVCISCGAPLIASLRGRYRPTMLLGQGGFGRTYLATDEDRLGSKCVIKQFSPQVQGTKSLQKAVQLFNQEAVRLHELGEHPQIPTLLAYFEQDTYLYLVQQFIEGLSLAQQVRRQGPFSEQQIRNVLNDILPVLQFIHTHQVIHRDITPSNILRRQIDQRLMLIDFGVAKQITQNSGALTGTRIGTEGYAPLEQFRSGKAYPASDLYSLGATCLHVMTGTRPDNLYDPLQGRWIWRDYLNRQGRPVSDRLAMVLDKLLRDLVNERYQSAQDVLTDLNADVAIATPLPVTPAAAGSSRTSTPGRASVSPGVTLPPSSASPLSNAATNLDLPSGLTQAKAAKTSGIPSGVKLSKQGCIYTLTGHSSWITCVALSADNQTVATSSLDNMIKTWNLGTGELLTTHSGHTRAINAIAISPSGRVLVSGSDDYTIKLWNVQTGELRGTLSGHTRDVNAIAISPDGRILASGGEDRTIRLWMLATGALLRTLMGVAGMVKAIAISPDGRVLVSGGLDNKIKVWSLQTGEQLTAWNAHNHSVNCVAVSPDNTTLVSASKDRKVKLWNLKTGELIRTFVGHSRDVNTVCFVPKRPLIVSGSADATIQFWDINTGESVITLREHSDSVNSIAVTSHGKILVSGSSDKSLKIWKVPRF